MPSPFAAAKISARRAVHQRFASLGVYTAPPNPRGFYPPAGYVFPQQVGFTVRWHDKLVAQVGDLENSGYAQVFEGVDTLVFTQDELDLVNFPLARNGTVTLPDYEMTLQLDTLYPPNGPINVVWAVTRQPYNPELGVPLSMAGGGIGSLPDGGNLGFWGL